MHSPRTSILFYIMAGKMQTKTFIKNLNLEDAVWWAIVDNLNLNRQHNFKPLLHYDLTLKFQTEIKNNFYFVLLAAT